MLNTLNTCLSTIGNWSIWTHLKLVESHAPTSNSIFDFPEFLTVLALFMIIVTNSDFRYTYRLSLLKNDLKVIGIWISGTVGFSILFVDIWFENHLPVPEFLANSNNIKAALGLLFLIFIFRVVFIVFIRPPQFQQNNAEQFFDSNFYLIHQGNIEKLQVIAEELRRSMQSIIKSASRNVPAEQLLADTKISDEKKFARNLLLLIGDNRFCSTVVEKVPSFAIVCFQEAQKCGDTHLPIYQFAHNIGQSFIKNTNSSFYQEDSGHQSGLIGYSQPVTRIIFGNYRFVESCARDGESPLDVNYQDLLKFNEQQIEGFSRAALAFFRSYLIENDGNPDARSVALNRIFSLVKDSVDETYTIDGKEQIHNLAAYHTLGEAAHFIRSSMSLVEELAAKPENFRIPEVQNWDLYDDLANLIFEIIFASSYVATPRSTAWTIQHNLVWTRIFSFQTDSTSKIIALKVRRLIYNEIKEMDEFPNFKGARILGLCLNILGLRLTDRHSGFRKSFFPLHAFVLDWTKQNFARLIHDHPKVAETCLLGSISYDSENHRLVKSFSSDLEREPVRHYLDLN